jgi:hypothetical protein
MKKGEAQMISQYDKAYKEYSSLPEVLVDPLDMPEDISHMVYRAQHEIDLIEEGERDDDMPSRTDINKIKRFIKKWSGK